MSRVTGALTILLTLCPIAADAQDTAARWAGLQTSLFSDVYVVDGAGHETKGVLLRVDPDGLVVLANKQEQRIDAGRVWFVERRGDPLLDGAIKGGVVGLIVSSLAISATHCSGSTCLGDRLKMLLLFTGSYTALGTLLDAIDIGRTTVYEAGRPKAARPTGTLGNAHYGFSFHVGW